MSNMQQPIDLSLAIPTYNEALHTERSIASVKGFLRDILGVDSNSPDNEGIEARWMDERIVPWVGRTIDRKGGFADGYLSDLTFFTKKHNKYVTREAIDRLIKKYALVGIGRIICHEWTSIQARYKRFAREEIYNKRPIIPTKFVYFELRYKFKLGILDRKFRLICQLAQGFWCRFLGEARALELDQGLKTGLRVLEYLQKAIGSPVLSI